MKRELTEDLASPRERASATSKQISSRRAAPALENSPQLSYPEGPLGLGVHQAWFVDVITREEGEPLALDEPSAERLVRGDSRLTAAQRLELYRQSYHRRLIECLRDDYPVACHACGEEEFERLCRGYIAAYPSRGPNLNRFGQDFPEHARQSAREHAAALADLAALEWAIVLAVHAPTRAPMSSTDVARIPAARFPSARLVPNPSLRILRLDYPVNAYFQAVRSGGTAHFSEIAAASRGPLCVAVYRTERKVYRMELSPALAALFESLAAGQPLYAALERALPKLEGTGQSEAEMAQLVMRGFRDGVESGLFAGISAD